VIGNGQIEGPASFAINNSTGSKTAVKNLSAGFYHFEKTSRQYLMQGRTREITLPPDSVMQDVTNSGYADGKIIEWLWTHIEGPASLLLIIPQVHSQPYKILQFIQGKSITVNQLGLPVNKQQYLKTYHQKNNSL
jgi:hypothetical protein